MSIGAIITLAATILIACALASAAIAEHRRRERNRALGPEYDHVIDRTGGRRAADREIRRRRRAHDALRLTMLSPDKADYYRTTWDHVQGSFVDAPAAALSGADRLIRELLSERGYPGGDHGEQIALASMAHSGAITDYRDAEQVSRRIREDPAAASTEEMRDAMLCYHRFLDDVLTKGTADRAERVPDAGAQR